MRRLHRKPGPRARFFCAWSPGRNGRPRIACARPGAAWLPGPYVDRLRPGPWAYGNLARGPRAVDHQARAAVPHALALVPGPWAELRAWCALVAGTWPAIRGPWALDLVAVDLVPELRALVRAAWCAIRGPSTWCPGPWPVLPGARPGGLGRGPGASPGGRSVRWPSTANPGPRFGARVRCAKALARFRTVNYALNSFRVRFLWVHVSRGTFLPKVPLSVQNALGQKFFAISNETDLYMHPGESEDIELQRARLELRMHKLEAQDRAKENFLDFVRYVWPAAILGRHHTEMAEAFDRIAKGSLKRLIINMPPRHTKSEFASYLLPAYIMGRKPSTKIIEATHTGELAVRFGRKVRDLMSMETYKEIFTDVELKQDSKAAGRWDTDHGGEYFAVGVGGAMTGRGADLLIIDDPHSEQDAASDLALENCWDWYTSGPRSRLQPGGAVVIVMTRWGTKDLTARLLKAQASHKADRWEVIEFPAILPSGKPLWPEFWSIDELQGVKASLSAQKWNAMYQQQPTNDEGAILKREWWRVWPHDEPPPVDYIIQSYDTAYSKKETADFSAITTWGVFYPDQDSGPNIILLGVRKGRWDFPELKRIAKDEYDEWKPDNVLIEAKATGITLQQELRRVGIPVTMYSPGGRRSGQDKIARANSVAPILEAGMVWAPDTDWADELVEECAAFPNGDNDDLVDTTTQALMRFRSGNFVALDSDYLEESKNESLVPEYY